MKSGTLTILGFIKITFGPYDINFLLYVSARLYKCQGWRVGPRWQGARPSRADTCKETHITTGASNYPSTTLLEPRYNPPSRITSASWCCPSLFLYERLTDDCHLITFRNERVSSWVPVWEHPSAYVSQGRCLSHAFTPKASWFSLY